MAKDVSIDKTNEQPYCIYSIAHNQAAMRNLSKPGYYLYTYLIQHQDGYVFTLRRTHVMNITGLSKSSYYDALQELLNKKYLIEQKGGYEFHECPTS